MFSFSNEGSIWSSAAFQGGAADQLSIVTFGASDYVRLRFGQSGVEYFRLEEGQAATRVANFTPDIFSDAGLTANLDQLSSANGDSVYLPLETSNNNLESAIGYSVNAGYVYFTATGENGTLEASLINLSTEVRTALPSAFASPVPELDYVSDMVRVDLDDGPVFFAASITQDDIQSFTIGTDGRLSALDSFDGSDGLFINGVSDLVSFEASGQNFIAIASPDASDSLVLVHVESDGSLDIVDQILANTQVGFAGARAIDAVSLDGRAFLVTASTNALSLLEVLPNGRLLDVSRGLDREGLFAGNATSLKAQVVGQDIQVFLTVEGTDDLLQLTVDMTSISAGAAPQSQLLQAADDASVIGGAGNDVILDGAGSETLQGMAGADIFVFQSDGQVDYIDDFQLGLDQIDLSALGLAYSISALDFTTTADGFSVVFGEETLHVRSADGNFITEDQLVFKDLFNINHAPGILSEIGIDPGDPGGGGGDPGGELMGSLGDDTITGTDDDDVVMGMDGNDTLYGGAGDDQISGDLGNDVLYGGDDHDWIDGGQGDDFIYGDAGRDTIVASQGDDIVDGGPGTDTLDFSAMTHDLAIDLSVTTLQSADAVLGTDQYRRFENITGGDGHDTFIGNNASNVFESGDGNDVLEGGIGNDTLMGGSGVDYIEGGAGNDMLYGGDGLDMLRFFSAGTSVIVDLRDAGQQISAGEGLGTDQFEGFEYLGGSNAGNDHLTGDNSDNRILGYGGNDVLYGLDGDDFLNGQGGLDTLYGGAGADRLNGGAGRDVFAFADVSDSTPVAHDVITTFQRGGLDKIDLREIDANVLAAGDQAFKYIGSGAFSGKAGELRRVNDTPNKIVTVYGDVDGDGIADFELEAQNLFGLNKFDMFL
ncbi:MAG: M10 family metallopeptidase C-terminal domain-containing protein [Pseudomonadota bacterium]